ncbi:sugar ABC transporter substrate-binding protein [Biomaibacter acetigenes]|jgi:formiminotetrahydrofolate cyclodeaminase|uniref:Sugar ABC transporter substrate-binding protein n=1 Tax=Biomaibacter acetigenes TaxID=2316383 RepID=A0A3G2R6W5_9FIRM|nr:cyclodeaminase/cyclohydrolase family protein [Biomaibacter acetigenes]AYO31294.1 sugar ABC transporter substrate-binding protein [Biomaibacter acetigenes]RKL61788.1 sugar ABC transporter substrate-binding protein [Thermoanaerobacteraceae bacterium SP2]
MLIKKSCEEFIEVLASKEPVPGGGGAAALMGAVGMALGNMVGNLTVGKEKYKDAEKEVYEIMEKARNLQDHLLKLVDEDAEVFKDVAAAYKMPKETEEQKKQKEEAMQKALKKACSVPLDIMKSASEAIKLQRRLADIGSKLAISDVGVGTYCLKAALLSGRLNVLINLNGITDKDFVKKTSEEMELLVKQSIEIADETNKIVEQKLKV